MVKNSIRTKGPVAEGPSLEVCRGRIIFFCKTYPALRTPAVTLLMMMVLSAWSTKIYGQRRVTQKTAHATTRSGKGHVKSGHSSRRVSSMSPGAPLGRNKQLSVSVTLSRTSRHAEADKAANSADMTAGYVTEGFRRQKGHLVWPVDSRKVVMRFGYQPYELAPSVHINNLGINIAVDKDSSVRVVYDGVIDDVMDIGEGKAVMVLHGKYFTIYSDLASANVVKGQQVTAGDVLGQVGETGQVDFRIYDPYDVWQDPEKWLVRGK